MMIPLVTLVMPTYNRAKFIPTAFRCFLQQTYPSIELIVVDDGTETYEVPKDERIHIIKIAHRVTTGEKRNIGANEASGGIIASLDDDDWSSPHRIEDEVQRLMKTGKAVTGYNATIVYDAITGKFHKNRGGPPYFASGTSQCYWKHWWQEHPFPNVCYGEDSVFAREARLADQLAIAEPGQMMVARKHNNNIDEVTVSWLPVVPRDRISAEFFRAIGSSLTGLDYMQERHICTNECQLEAAKQFNLPVVDYKVNSLPEVQTRQWR